MFDVNKIRNDFPIFNQQVRGKDLIYFDSGATALKPQVVIDEIVQYYSQYSVNAHRGDYYLSYIVDTKYEHARNTVAKFINASSKEIVFTTGTTVSINLACESFFKKFLKPGDEIILNEAEHASNLLPWYHLQEAIGVKIVFAKLNDDATLSVESIKNAISDKTKLISLAHITNTIGDCRDVKAICQIAKANDIYTFIDGAQSAPHQSIDVVDLDCDFFAFSGHKLCGPTGIGVLYGKKSLLDQMNPYQYGGGMNSRFNKEFEVKYKTVPTVFEAGTQNIEGVLGLATAIEYLLSIGMENIHEHELKLKAYCIEQLSHLDNITVYNKDVLSGNIIFNVNDVFAQDIATHCDSYGICVRAGHHCAKILNNVLNCNVTCRASFYFYNTFEEIDKFVECLAKGDEYLAAIF